MRIPAKYTIVLKTLMDDPEAYAAIREAMSTYPLYIGKSKKEFIPVSIPTREELNKKILSYYKYREIGFETPARFLDELETALNEIMPRYNLLFASADQDFNIIHNVDYTKTGERTQNTTNQATNQATQDTTGTSATITTANDTATTHTDATAFDKHVETKTPQSAINTPAQSINDIQYADGVTWGKNESTGNVETTTAGETQTDGSTTNKTTSTGTASGTVVDKETNTETIKGNFGVVSAQDLVLKFRETIINIEQMIINDPRISELFMLIY